MDDAKDSHWLESPISLWQLVASILGLVVGGGATWVAGDRAAEARIVRLEVRQEGVIAQQRAQDALIEFLRTIAESNRIALAEIKSRLDANGAQLREIQAVLATHSYKPSR
jgi:hypothetical protein